MVASVYKPLRPYTRLHMGRPTVAWPNRARRIEPGRYMDFICHQSALPQIDLNTASLTLFAASYHIDWKRSLLRFLHVSHSSSYG